MPRTRIRAIRTRTTIRTPNRDLLGLQRLPVGEIRSRAANISTRLGDSPVRYSVVPAFERWAGLGPLERQKRIAAVERALAAYEKAFEEGRSRSPEAIRTLEGKLMSALQAH